MIKFFRHIRQQLIQKNQMRKYFKYAIGEIILVVVGILIALGINNWNENRKAENSRKQVMQNLKEEFQNNFKLLKSQEERITKTNKNLIKLMNYSASRQAKKQVDSLKHYVSNMLYTFSLPIKKTTLDGLLNSGEIMLLDNRLNGLLTEFSKDFDTYIELNKLSNERVISSDINKLLLKLNFHKAYLKATYPNENIKQHPSLTKNDIEFDSLIKSSDTYTALSELLILELARKTWSKYLKNKVNVILLEIDKEMNNVERND